MTGAPPWFDVAGALPLPSAPPAEEGTPPVPESDPVDPNGPPVDDEQAIRGNERSVSAHAAPENIFSIYLFLSLAANRLAALSHSKRSTIGNFHAERTRRSPRGRLGPCVSRATNPAC